MDMLELLFSVFPLLQLLEPEELHGEMLHDIELLLCTLLHELQPLYKQHDNIQLDGTLELELTGEEQLGLLQLLEKQLVLH